MATKNFFDLLGDDENEDPAQVVVRANSFAAADDKPAANAGATKKPAAGAAAKLPSKPAPPSEAVRDGPRGQYDGSRGGRGGGRGGRGGRGDREGGGPREGGGYRERGSYNNDRNVGSTRDADGFVGGRGSHGDKPVRIENGEGRSYEGGRNRGGRGRGYGEGDERPRRREFDRHSGNPRGYETEKRAGSGRANWGTDVDPALIQETVEGVKEEEKPAVEGAVVDEKKPESEPSAEVVTEEGAAAEKKEEEEEDNEMTLEEYEKVLEEKRKSLEAAKAAERKVEVDKSFSKMQLVDNKKRDEDIFIKLGADKEKVKREAAEREEKSRKPVSINEFLKPAEGEKYYGPPSNRGRGGRGGRGDRREGGERREGGGRGDRDRESSRGGFGGGRFGGRGGAGGGASAPKIEDQAQFPTLGGK